MQFMRVDWVRNAVKKESRDISASSIELIRGGWAKIMLEEGAAPGQSPA